MDSAVLEPSATARTAIHTSGMPGTREFADFGSWGLVVLCLRGLMLRGLGS